MVPLGDSHPTSPRLLCNTEDTPNRRAAPPPPRTPRLGGRGQPQEPGPPPHPSRGAPKRSGHGHSPPSASSRGCRGDRGLSLYCGIQAFTTRSTQPGAESIKGPLGLLGKPQPFPGGRPPPRVGGRGAAGSRHGQIPPPACSPTQRGPARRGSTGPRGWQGDCAFQLECTSVRPAPDRQMLRADGRGGARGSWRLRGAPGEPMRRAGRERPAARPASAPEAGPAGPGARASGSGFRTRVARRRGAAALCAGRSGRSVLEQAGGVCSPIQKVSANVIHLQINF